MNERVKFVAPTLDGEESFSDLCARFGISRKQGYKWRQRYESGGADALVDRSRLRIHIRTRSLRRSSRCSWPRGRVTGSKHHGCVVEQGRLQHLFDPDFQFQHRSRSQRRAVSGCR